MRRDWVKRFLDLFLSMAGLVVLSPVLAVLALLIKCSDGGPVLFRQERVGQRGRLFRICKFRSMVVQAPSLGPAITQGGDPRVTRIGRMLRKSKLDELPQLWNVLWGEMSLVGPRPEVPKYVAAYSPEQRRVLDLKPGITDLATLWFRNEEELLRQAPDADRFYLEYCLGRKIELNLAYAHQANLWEDLKIILRTIVPGLTLPCRAERQIQAMIETVPGPTRTAGMKDPG